MTDIRPSAVLSMIPPRERARYRDEAFGLRFAAAKTPLQLEELRVYLTGEVSNINAQLSEREVVASAVSKEAYVMWRKWRGSAITAKSKLEQQLAQVKLRLKQIRTVYNNGTVDQLAVDSVERLLRDADNLIHRLVRAFDVTPEEQQEVDRLSQRIRSYTATHGSIDSIAK